jgi:hypothetical protein
VIWKGDKATLIARDHQSGSRFGRKYVRAFEVPEVVPDAGRNVPPVRDPEVLLLAYPKVTHPPFA